ncbi:MAG: TlpA family protein disulfide reductase [Caldisericales bacterium]|nr:TlpA family protein disulfide reductase [Caldisericales bacterium]
MKRIAAIMATLAVASLFVVSCGPQREIIVDEIPAKQEQQVADKANENNKLPEATTNEKSIAPKDIIDMVKPSGNKSQKQCWFSPVSLARIDGLSKQVSWFDEKGFEKELTSFGGKLYLIDVWAQWCPPCRASTPVLLDWHKKYGDKGLVIIGINIDSEENLEQARTFATEEGIPYDIFWDNSGGKVGGVFVQQGIPNFTLLDEKGGQIKEKVGMLSSDDPETNTLEKVIKERLGL